MFDILFYIPRGVMTQIGPPPALSSPSYANGINNSGQIAGYGTWINNTSNDHAFLILDSAVLDLDTLGGIYSSANAINNLGRVVGWANTATYETVAFLYDGGGKLKNLGSLFFVKGGWNSCTYAINNAGQIVGGSIAPDNFQHAFCMRTMP